MHNALALAAILLLFVGLASVLPAHAGQIKKCQDAQGNWHYGDRAAEECARSKVIELSNEGVKTREIKPPITDEQAQARARALEEAEEARRRAQEQARRDQQLLATYGHEDDIIYIRDRKLSQIDANIAAANETVKPMRAVLQRMRAEAEKIRQRGGEVPADLVEQISTTQAQISRHEASIAAKRREQEAIREQAQADLERYRELKTQQAQTLPEPPAAGAPSRKP